MNRMKKSKELCEGCYNNEYNHGLGGSKSCWSYEGAIVSKKLEIGVNQMPPFKQKPIDKLSCYTQMRVVYVNPENITKDGYWK